MSSLSATELFHVKGMVFVITGAGSGLGATMAKALDENGAAKVYILGRRIENLQAVAKSAVNGSLIPIRADVTSKADLSAVAARIKAETGFVNAVIANAGTLGPTNAGLPQDRVPTVEELQSFLWKTPQEEYTNTFAINTTGVFYTCIAFLSLLDAGNKDDRSVTVVKGIKSQFIAVSSVAGFNRKLVAGFSYPGSKAATNHLVKSLATFLVPYHIRANVIAPGIYPTELSNVSGDSIKEGSFPQSAIPLTRAGTEEDIAAAILSLCGRGGAYYNGHVLLTDGGRLSLFPSTY